MNTNKFKTVDEYMATLSPAIRALLEKLRKIIKEAAPQAEEGISYNMPVFKQNGVLVYYAAFKNHIGFFPGASGVAAFKDELTNYKTSKGTIQFTFEKGIPITLVTKIVKYRLRENIKKAKKKNI